MKILWIPHDTWRNPQRARLFCEKLSKKHEVHVTDYDACFRSPADFLSRRYIRNYFYSRGKDDGITVHHVPRISPALFSKKLRALNYKLFSRYVKQIIDEHEIDAVIGTFVCKPPKARHLVFDVFDDNPAYWLEFGKLKSYADEVGAIEREYLNKADEVVVVSSVLAEKIENRKTILIPNGVEIEKYRRADGDKIRDELDLNGTVIGLIGSHGKFSGLMKVIQVAEMMKDVTFLIVGGGSELSMAKQAALKKNLNVVFTGWVSNVENYYKAIDVGLLPFTKSVFTDSACPIKLLEYTAAGKPVASTDLEEVKRMNFSNVILVKDSPSALADGINKALNIEVRIPRKIEGYDIDKLAQRYEKVLLQ